MNKVEKVAAEINSAIEKKEKGMEMVKLQELFGEEQKYLEGWYSLIQKP